MYVFEYLFTLSHMYFHEIREFELFKFVSDLK